MEEKTNKPEYSNLIFNEDSADFTLEGADYNDYLKKEIKIQDMKNFDKRFINFVYYIIKITHEIWEEKGIGVIYDTYHNNVIMHFGSFNTVGIQGVISGTLSTLYSFPDRKLIGQNVIWSKHKKNGFLSSHRIISTATNLNDSTFGPATGKKINFRTMVDCAVENNRIYEEWLVRDNLWIVKQLGFDSHEVAMNMAQNSIASSEQASYGLGENTIGQIFPEHYNAKDSSVGELLLEMLKNVYAGRYFNKVTKYYDEKATLHYICDKDLIGHSQIQGMLVSLFASFPNSNFLIDRITCNKRVEENTYDVAVRWRIIGLHEGFGMFGSASNNMVEILGINHYIVENNKIIEEWMTYDGLDILRQIYLNRYNKDFEKTQSEDICCQKSEFEKEKNENE